MSVIEETKELLSEDRFRIRLHDLVSALVHDAISQTGEEYFPSQDQWSPDQFLERIEKYNTTMSDLNTVQALLAFWGTDMHRNTVTLAPKRLAGSLRRDSGISAWNALRRYPVMLLLYAGGIAALAGERYDHLRMIMHTRVSDPEGNGAETTLIQAVFNSFDAVHDAFKCIPGHEKNRVPRSEYLFRLLQPTLDQSLCLGADYERHFDQFEVLLALEIAEQKSRELRGRAWGPVGRFGWKYHRGAEASPLHRVLSEATAMGDAWPPIKAGLFQGSVERFRETSSQYTEHIARLGWW